MKKTIITIIGLLGLLSIASNDVFAATYKYHNYVYEGDKIENIYFKNKDDTLKEAHIYQINDSNKIIYSIEYDNDTNGASRDDYDDYYDYRKTNLTKAQASLANLIGYYGYNYKDDTHDHTDIKWYAITQYLIWQVETDNNLKAIVNEKGEPIFTDEIEEINDLIDKHYIKPDFGSLSIQAKAFDEITIEDKNGVLKQYETLELFGLDYQVEENKIKATSNQNKSHTIYMTKKDNRFSHPSIFYVSETYRNAMEIGSYEEITSSVKLNFISGKVTINKLGEQLIGFKDNKFIYEYRQATGVIYHLYAKDDIYNNVGKLLYKKDELVRELVIGQDESFDNLYLSEYYAKEVYTPYAYHVTGNPYKVNLSFNVVSQSITYKSPYQPVVIRFASMKQTANFASNITYALTPLANATFGLYTGEDIYSDIDSTTPIVSKDTLIDIQKSDASGTVNFKTDIPEGEYYIVNLDDNDYYHAKETSISLTFRVDPSVDRQYFNLKNYYALLNTQNITFKGSVNLQILDDNKNILIESNIEEEKTFGLPFGNYYYQFEGSDYILLEVYDTLDRTIILNKDDINEEKNPDTTDSNESIENAKPNEEEKDDEGLNDKENKDEETNNTSSDEKNENDCSNEEGDYIKNPPIVVLPNPNNRPNHENKNEDISMDLITPPNNSSDKEDNQETEDTPQDEIKDDLNQSENPRDEENTTTDDLEDKDGSSNPSEDIENNPDDIIKNPSLDEETNDNEENPDNSNDESNNSSASKEDNPSVAPDEIMDDFEDSGESDESDNSNKPNIEISDSNESEEEKPSIDPDETLDNPGNNDKNDNTIDEDLSNSFPKEDEVIPLPTNPDVEDNDETSEVPDNSSNTLDNEDNSSKEEENIILDKENNSSNNEFLNNTITDNYDQIDVRVPATDKDDYSLILYIFILLISSLAFVRVKN